MEIELKLSLDPAHVARLRHHPSLAGVKPLSRRLHSVYLDTPAWDLVRRAIALRVRRVGRKWVQTLKAESASVGALTRRPEWEQDLTRGHHDLSRLPQEALTLLEGVDMSLVGPVFITAFRRTTWWVEMAGASMEVALDEGEIRAGARTLPLCEVEIELKSGPREALFELALALLETVPMGVEPRSKAARGYALAGAVASAPVKAVPPRLGKAMTGAEAWTLLAESALVQMVGNVPGFLTMPEHLEYLHQLRIGARRLSAVAALAPSVERPALAWGGELKALMAVLNGARDWDVLLHELLPRLEPLLTNPPLGQGLKRHLHREATAARQAALGAISGPVFTRLVLEMGRDLLSHSGAERALRPWAAECLDGRWQRLLKRGKGFADLDAARRHRLRIAAKRLRYTADALASVFPRTDKFIARVAALQNKLGASQDGVMAARLIGGMGSRSAAIMFDAGRIVGILAAEMEGQGRGGGKAWRALRQSRPFWRLKPRKR